AGTVNRGQIFRFPEDGREAIRLAPRPRGLDDLVDDDPPAADREPDENPDHHLDHRPRAEQQPNHAQPASTAHILSPLPQQPRILYGNAPSPNLSRKAHGGNPKPPAIPLG